MMQKLQVHLEGTFETPDRLYIIIKETLGRHKGNRMREQADNPSPKGKLVSPQIGGRNRIMVGAGLVPALLATLICGGTLFFPPTAKIEPNVNIYRSIATTSTPHHNPTILPMPPQSFHNRIWEQFN